MITPGKRYLITADHWFLAPDGEEYRGVWGKCKVVEAKEQFGFVPQRPSTNWFLQVGEGENSMILAGCQIHYAVECDKKPFRKEGTYTHECTKTEMAIGKIYFTE
jgi:hypothetical protein